MSALGDFEIPIKDKFQMKILLQPGTITRKEEYEEVRKAIRFEASSTTFGESKTDISFEKFSKKECSEEEKNELLKD